MNKKFSTLMAGGFLLTSVFASAQVTPATLGGQELKEVEFSGDVTKGTYFIVQESDGNNELSAGDQILSVTKSGDVLTYSAPYFQYATLDESAYLWTLEVTQDGNVSPKYFYALKKGLII